MTERQPAGHGSHEHARQCDLLGGIKGAALVQRSRQVASGRRARRRWRGQVLSIMCGCVGGACGRAEGHAVSHRLDAGLVAAGVEDQRDGDQCGGDDDPQQQHGLLPAQARVRRCACGRAMPRRGCHRARRRRWAADRPRRTRIFSRTGISSSSASWLKMFSWKPTWGRNQPGRPQ